MATSDRPETASASGERALPAWVPLQRTDAATLVAGVAVLALVVRLLFLGDRIAHWDEARVGYWILHAGDTGSFAYRRIIHGPFVQHVNRWLFPLVGANDYTMRLPVALVGGLLPLSALLFREHLRKVELVAMALFLAFNPVLLYYSRFMRSDVLVAAFMFVALGLLVRFHDTRRARYLYGAAVFTAFGFASKENAVIYVATWVGAAALLADQALFRPREHDSGWDLLAAKGRAVADRVDADRDAVARLAGRYAIHVAGAVVLFLAVSVFMYAPRGAGMAGLEHPPAAPGEGAVGFWQGFASPSDFVAMLEGTATHSTEQFGRWIERAGDSGGDQSLIDEYVEFLRQYVDVMASTAAPLTAFAVFGFVVERYGARTARNLVLFAGYCGFVSVLGYPLGTDIFGAWLVVHALVPLAIPAAVGVATVYDWAYESFVVDDVAGVAIAAVLLLLVAGQVAFVATSDVYVDHQSDDNVLVQYAQPGGDLRAELQTMAAVAEQNGGETDVLLYYGEQGGDYDGNVAFVDRDEDAFDTSSLDLRPLCANWYNSLPLPWYFASDDVEVECERDGPDLADRVANDPPPMVITQDSDSTVPAAALEDEYEGSSYEMRTWGRDTTFWVHEDWADATA